MRIDTARVLAADKVDRLAATSTDAGAFWREATDVLRPVLPFDFHPCWFSVDPVTLLITGHINEGLDATPPELAHAWYVEGDVNSPQALASLRNGATTVKEATSGDPVASWRWRQLLQPRGFDDSLDAVLRRGKTVWGAINLLHTPESRPFNPEDVRFLSKLSPALATGTQLGLLRPRDETNEDGAPGVIIATPDFQIISATENAESWLAALPDTGHFRPDRLPMPVQVVVLRASRATGEDSSITVRSTRGGWIRINASRLGDTKPPQVAVVIEPAPPQTVTPIRLAAYDLTPREHQVVELVLRGRSTTQIADELFISTYTVQDRLKSVFEKMGLRSRRELVATVHTSDYQPLITSNDQRTQAGLPIRPHNPRR